MIGKRLSEINGLFDTCQATCANKIFFKTEIGKKDKLNVLHLQRFMQKIRS